MNRRTRLVPALVVGALALGTAVGTTPAASAAGGRSGDWLEGQLTGGLIHNDVYDFDDYGLTADTAMALTEIGGHRPAVKKVKRALAHHVDSWTTGVDFGSSDIYAGSVAKAVVFAQVAGADPTAFGGVDLVDRLEGRISTADGTTGRLQDQTDGTDYANTLGQAYAVAALSRAGSSAAATATTFLLDQQCDAGFFRLYFADKAAADQTCDGAARSDRAPDTDATAVAVAQLQSVHHPSRVVKSAIADALRWLVRHQKDNGSFGGGPTTSAANTNSTGLAARALARGGKCRAADNATDWVAGLQKKNGAIAYDRKAYRAGISDDTLDQWRRATSQAAPSLQLPGC
ncbi:prenyltransferase/squalene oxidase repeat-containing protein [Nocardioides sp. URHA0032]|uniref:prenyltransferase/squalene oxidase repeat-containing protein n=1 Tax=Nocardioides sp. URHA0032 TaxID=1380388 RepID=UPI00048BB84E|nr:prenyltransferase/squalene oxidase repeat-containing protein [Nocardioides sp. URHA0032]